MAGGLGGAVTPVPFPNTDVKGPRGDGTTPRSVGEQRAAGLLLQAPSLSTEAGGLFLWLRARGGARPSPCGTFHVEQFHRIILVGGKAKYLENIEACSILLFQILER